MTTITLKDGRTLGIRMTEIAKYAAEIVAARELLLTGSAHLELPACKKIEFIWLSENIKLTLPICEKAGGIIRLDNDATLTLPLCEAVENIWLTGTSILKLPMCKKTGDICLDDTATLTMQTSNKIKSGWFAGTATLITRGQNSRIN